MYKDPHQKEDRIGGIPVEISVNFFRFEKVMK
jgi:hypothetical protein